MAFAEKELTIQVRHLDCVQIDNLERVKTGEHEILQQFAADAACTNYQDFCVGDFRTDRRVVDIGGGLCFRRILIGTYLYYVVG